jgi:hypothetical protein
LDLFGHLQTSFGDVPARIRQRLMGLRHLDDVDLDQGYREDAISDLGWCYIRRY